MWRRVYGFEANKNGLFSRKHKYVKRVFKENPHKHNGYGMADCIDPRARARCWRF